MDWYKWMWTHIGGRPWTYILRDVWDNCEFVWIVGLVVLGVWLGKHADWMLVLIIWGAWAVGYIMGHLFWGTPHISGQTGDDNGSTGDRRRADRDRHADPD